MSDSDSDGDGERPELSPAVLALLEQHLQRGKDATAGAGPAAVGVLMNASPGEEVGGDMLFGDDYHNNKKFVLKEYWDERFKTEESYDWLLTLDDVEEHLLPLLPCTNSRILMVGCGNSSLSRDLYELGYTNITNIDFSEVVIRKMAQRHAETHPLMGWIVADMTDMTAQFPASGLFDVIIDKASMDALVVVEEDVWNPQETVIENVHRYLSECSRLLDSKAGSRMVQITFHQPHFRSKYLSGARQLQLSGEAATGSSTSIDSGYSGVYRWALSHSTVASNVFDYFLFVMDR